MGGNRRLPVSMVIATGMGNGDQVMFEMPLSPEVGMERGRLFSVCLSRSSFERVLVCNRTHRSGAASRN
jgi:hypothetical protein